MNLGFGTMTATATIYLFLSIVLGFGLGFFYFRNLWKTVRKLPVTDTPVRLFFGNYLARLAIAIVGLFLITSGHWERALGALLGFTLARIVLVRKWGPHRLQETAPLEE